MTREMNDDQADWLHEVKRDKRLDRIAELEAERDKLRKALRLICEAAKPKYLSVRSQLVKSGIAMSGSLEHYEIPPHLIHSARAALEVE